MIDRRNFLHSSLALLGAYAVPSWAQDGPQGTASAFRLIDVLPFQGDGHNYVRKLHGEGLEGRLAFDVSTLTRRRLITPQDKFFIRTRYPSQLDPTKPWQLKIDGLVDKPLTLDLSQLPPAMDLGTHLLECAGSTRNSSFGLMSAARWSGVPMEQLLGRWKVDPRASHVLVSGVDPLQGPNPGASWIFPIEDLRRGALGLRMNGEPLSPDHGFPVRLMMPGWYGCCWIKWLRRVTFLDDRAQATAHMKEYAGRTLQSGVPSLARDFAPARIDAAAMPVRVEMWEGPEGLFYRIVGIVWGGERSPKGLVIRCVPEHQVAKVADFAPSDHRTWSLWSHVWRPQRTGEYDLQLAFEDDDLPSRRLRQGYYLRRVNIREI